MEGSIMIQTNKPFYALTKCHMRLKKSNLHKIQKDNKTLYRLGTLMINSPESCTVIQNDKVRPLVLTCYS